MVMSLLLLILLTWTTLSSTQSLPALNIVSDAISVSGFSSGGFMAAQLGLAYSSLFRAGFGVFAGGPYDCARSRTQWENCMYNATPPTILPSENIRRWSKEGLIDDVANLKGRRVFLQAGTEDDVIGVGPVRQLEKQLEGFVGEEGMRFEVLQGAGHVFPTNFAAEGNCACGDNQRPFIADCGFDGAGAVLQWLYGDLKPRARPGSLQGKTTIFDQTGPYAAPGLGSKGVLFIPKACESGEECKLHVVLHGCTQGYEQIGLQYVSDTGYREWADTNNIVLLFPQATVSYEQRRIWNGTLSDNAQGCFDWIGWTGANADRKGGPQMQAIVAMVEALSRHRGERLRDEI